jgi:hypothetical protein
VVTSTGWVPAIPPGAAGAVAAQEVDVVHVTAVAGTPPKVTVLPVVPVTKPVPVMVTTVPATSGPAVGLNAVTAGDPKVYLSAALVAEVSPDAVTVISTVPATSAGEVNTHVVVDEHDAEVAATVPNMAVVAAVPVTKPVPVTVTEVPPATKPAVGVIADTVGGAATLKLKVQVPVLPAVSTSVPDTV